MQSSDAYHRWLMSLGTAMPVIILAIAVLSIPLAAAQQMDLSPSELSSWILALYGLPSLLSVIFAIRYREPLLFTGNVFVMIFIASLEGQHSFPELVGASIVAGICVVLLSTLGLTDQLAELIPAPIVLGLLAGEALPFVVDVFSLMGDAPAIVSGVFLAFLWGHRFLGKRVPAILPALVAGLAIAAATGELGTRPADIPLPSITVTAPAFSIESIATLTPVLVILLTLQSNLPSMVYLRCQHYQLPERELSNVSGFATAAGSLFGPTGVSLALTATSLVAGPEAGDRKYRFHAAWLASGVVLLLALLSGVAADLPTIIPLELLLSLAGLAIVGVLSHALQEIFQSPLLLGPVFAFAISLSDIHMLGFGPFIWALVLGYAVSFLAERDAMQQLHAPANTPSPQPASEAVHPLESGQ